MSSIQDRLTIESEGFFLAAFGIDGNLEGEGKWKHQDLSERWLTLCYELLAYKGVNFDHRWTGNLAHLRVKMTSANGASICTFFVNDRTVSSVLLLRGDNQQSELEISAMLIESLQRSNLVGAPSDHLGRFEGILSLKQRPLMVAVPFPDMEVSDQDHDLVREFSLHLASAFMRFSI